MLELVDSSSASCRSEYRVRRLENLNYYWVKPIGILNLRLNEKDTHFHRWERD